MKIPTSLIQRMKRSISILRYVLAPAFGKQLALDLKQSAFIAYHAMLAKNTYITERQGNTTVPAGAGNKWRRFYSPYLVRPEDSPNDNDGDIGQFN